MITTRGCAGLRRRNFRPSLRRSRHLRCEHFRRHVSTQSVDGAAMDLSAFWDSEMVTRIIFHPRTAQREYNGPKVFDGAIDVGESQLGYRLWKVSRQLSYHSARPFSNDDEELW